VTDLESIEMSRQCHTVGQRHVQDRDRLGECRSQSRHCQTVEHFQDCDTLGEYRDVKSLSHCRTVTRSRPWQTGRMQISIKILPDCRTRSRLWQTWRVQFVAQTQTRQRYLRTASQLTNDVVSKQTRPGGKWRFFLCDLPLGCSTVVFL